MYRPGALIPGAILFHEWLRTSGKPVVYLSNTGAKDGDAVRPNPNPNPDPDPNPHPNPHPNPNPKPEP